MPEMPAFVFFGNYHFAILEADAADFEGGQQVRKFVWKTVDVVSWFASTLGPGPYVNRLISK